MMARFDDTRDILWTCGDGGLPRWPVAHEGGRARLEFESSGFFSLYERLSLLASLLRELSPKRSMAFLIDDRRLRGLQEGPDRRAAEHVRHCVDDMLARDLRRGLRRLGGRGLAPQSRGGFVEGLLVAFHIFERASGVSLASARHLVFEEARTRDAARDALLYEASEGFVLESTGAVVRALARGSTDDVRRSVARSVVLGGCYGADSLLGLYMALRAGLPQRFARAYRTPVI